MVTLYRYTTCCHIAAMYIYTCLALSTLWPTTETQSYDALYNVSTSWLPISVLMLWHALENALKERKWNWNCQQNADWSASYSKPLKTSTCKRITLSFRLFNDLSAIRDVSSLLWIDGEVCGSFFLATVNSHGQTCPCWSVHVKHTILKCWVSWLLRLAIITQTKQSSKVHHDCKYS